jgi:hypothetical protein
VGKREVQGEVGEEEEGGVRRGRKKMRWFAANGGVNGIV